MFIVLQTQLGALFFKSHPFDIEIQLKVVKDFNRSF